MRMSQAAPNNTLKRNTQKITRLSTFLSCLPSRFGIINQLTKKYLSPYPLKRNALQKTIACLLKMSSSSPTSTVTSSLRKVSVTAYAHVPENYQFFPSSKNSPRHTVSFSDLKADCHNIETLCLLLISPPFRFFPLSNFNVVSFFFFVLSVTPFLFHTFLTLSLNHFSGRQRMKITKKTEK